MDSHGFQAKVGQVLHSPSLGRVAYQAARRILHLGRKIAHPNIPTNLGVVKVVCRGKRFSILHRRNYSDKLAITQCFQQEQYDMPNREHGVLAECFYQETLSAGKQPLIVDCGANMGASVLWFSARYPNAHILALEPAPDNFALLQMNCSGLDVDLRNAGIGGTDGLAHLIDTGWGTLAYRTASSGQGCEVSILTVETLLTSKPASHYVPFILKIDIEGGEKALFEGDCSAISRFPLIILEPHDWLLPGEGTSLPFFRFHAAAGREFCIKNENIASMDFYCNHPIAATNIAATQTDVGTSPQIHPTTVP